MTSKAGILFMRLLAHLPLRWIRALGWLLGWFLYFVVVPRRHVVNVNLALCFPGWSAQQRAQLVPRIFVAIAQSWLDRSWLWHGAPEVTRSRVQLTNAVEALRGSRPRYWSASGQLVTRRLALSQPIFLPARKATPPRWLASVRGPA